MEISFTIFGTIKTSNWFRSYGQKDPLSEFKKEAFTLFENLMEKIKNDVIKFLLNLNIVLADEAKSSDKDNAEAKLKIKK